RFCEGESWRKLLLISLMGMALKTSTHWQQHPRRGFSTVLASRDTGVLANSGGRAPSVDNASFDESPVRPRRRRSAIVFFLLALFVVPAGGVLVWRYLSS